MKNKPVVMALLIVGAIFLFFVFLAVLFNSRAGCHARMPLGERIGVVEIVGVIDSPDKIIENIHDFRDDASIKAIIIRIDSPGGAVAPSQEIYAEIKKADKVKPVVVSMGSVAASGGYYIAVAAQKIVANPGTMTGSIGVIMSFANYEVLLNKIGWRNEVVKSGRFKDIGSPDRPMTDEERRLLQTMIDDVQSQFVEVVAQGRHMAVDKVRGFADGRIMSGRQALAAGLVDELGGLEDAIDLAADMVGLEDPKVVYPVPAKPKLIDFVLQEVSARLFTLIKQQSRLNLNFL